MGKHGWIPLQTDPKHRAIKKRLKFNDVGVAGSLSRLSLTSAQVIISQSVSLGLASGSVLTAQLCAGAFFRFCVSLSLCPSPAHALSLSVSKINKTLKKRRQLLSLAQFYKLGPEGQKG